VGGRDEVSTIPLTLLRLRIEDTWATTLAGFAGAAEDGAGLNDRTKKVATAVM